MMSMRPSGVQVKSVGPETVVRNVSSKPDGTAADAVLVLRGIVIKHSRIEQIVRSRSCLFFDTIPSCLHRRVRTNPIVSKTLRDMIVSSLALPPQLSITTALGLSIPFTGTPFRLGTVAPLDHKPGQLIKYVTEYAT